MIHMVHGHVFDISGFSYGMKIYSVICFFFTHTLKAEPQRGRDKERESTDLTGGKREREREEEEE